MNSPDLDEQLESDVYSNLPSHNDSSTGSYSDFYHQVSDSSVLSTASDSTVLKFTGITTRRNRTSCKSKHSETEQRRRSKINERFQNLMDIIPQNDQKRDKASFLLEVIEYIHFLQEKVQMYEGSQQMWYQAPTKLIPWRNNHGPVVEVIDHPKSFSSNEKVAPPFGLLSDMESSVDRYVDLPASTKILEHSPISALSSYRPTEPLPQFVQHEFWQPRSCCGSMNCEKNELSNSDEKTSASLSTVYSQRVRHTLTEALKSSGVNMSETMISVQLSLRKRSDREYSFAAFASEDNCNSITDEEGVSPIEARSICKNLDHSQKRIR